MAGKISRKRPARRAGKDKKAKARSEITAKQILRSPSQEAAPLARGARPLSATDQAARLASARMERRIGQMLGQRIKLKFRP